MTILQDGSIIQDRYRVVQFLDEGGMQEVYLAEDVVLEKSVALKTPKTLAATRRFKSTAILSAKVNHPNTAKTLDFVEENGRPFLIEELIAGEDLAKARQRLRMMDPSLVAHVLHHMSRGVAASHHAGVVHRDLKPSNIMVSSALSFTHVKITDFGISKMALDEIARGIEGGDAGKTGSATLIGAIPYMSPEMLQAPKLADSAADVWALGSIAYELLTGTLPFGPGVGASTRIIHAQFPQFPRFGAQFQKLADDLFSIIRLCWTYDARARPNADAIVQACASLCYQDGSNRVQGRVETLKGAWGFIRGDSGESIFFHIDSVFGEIPLVDDRVHVACYPGAPYPRSHPVLKISTLDSPT